MTNEKPIVFIPLKTCKDAGPAVIDFEDLDKVRNYWWYLGTLGYVYTQIKVGRKWKTRHLHYIILGITPKPGYNVHHKNGDPMDNRKDNLEYLTTIEHGATRIRSNSPRHRAWRVYRHAAYKKSKNKLL